MTILTKYPGIIEPFMGKVVLGTLSELATYSTCCGEASNNALASIAKKYPELQFIAEVTSDELVGCVYINTDIKTAKDISRLVTRKGVALSFQEMSFVTYEKDELWHGWALFEVE